MHPAGVGAVKRRGGDTAGCGKNAVRKGGARGRGAAGAPTRDAAPTAELASDRVAPTAEDAPGLRGLPEEVAQCAAQLATALQDELLNSRATRREAERLNDAILPLLQKVREPRELFASGLEKLKARGSGKDAALTAFLVVELDRLIEDFECVRETNDNWIKMADEFEAQVGDPPALAAQAAAARRGTAAPAPAPADGGGQGDDAAPARAWRGTAEKITASSAQVGIPEEIAADIAAFERAYAETGNPLYVWDALSLLCVPLYVPGIRSEFLRGALLPGWCIEYLGRVAEAILGLPSPSVHPPGGMAEQAPQLSKALGLSRQGWDAFAEWRKDRAREQDADLYERVKALGIPDKDAMEAATEFWGLEDERSVRRRLRRGRRAKPAKPEA